MAIAYDTGVNAGRTSSTTTKSWSHTCTGSDRFLVVSVRLILGGTTATCTYNSVAMTRESVEGTTNNWLVTFTLTAPATGSNTVAVTATGSGLIDACSASFTGVSQTGQPTLKTNDTTSSQDNLTLTETSTTDNSWFIGNVISSEKMVASTGATLRVSVGSGYYQAIFTNGAITPAGSASMLITVNGSVFSYQQFMIAPVSVSSFIPKVMIF